jgi:hypothetical protein
MRYLFHHSHRQKNKIIPRLNFKAKNVILEIIFIQAKLRIQLLSHAEKLALIFLLPE